MRYPPVWPRDPSAAKFSRLFGQCTGKITDLFATHLFHDLFQLRFEHRDRMVAAVFAQGSDAVHKWPTHKRKISAICERATAVRTGTEATIYHYLYAVPITISQSFQRFNGRFARIDLSAAMVRHNHAI